MSTNQNGLSPQARWAWWCGLGVYVLAGIWGVAQAVFPYPNAVWFILLVMFAIFVTMWAINDAKARHRPILPVLQMLFFLFWPVGATVYLLARNGWRGILVAVLHGVCLYAATFLAYNVTFFSLHFAGMRDAVFIR